jgi:hypothetical protein
MKKESISGTGNGVNEKYIPDLIQSLEEYKRLLSSVIQASKKKFEKGKSIFN